MIKFKIKMEVIKNKLKKYLKASKKEKGEILDHLSNSLELSRVQIIRNFKKLQLKDSGSFKETRGRKIIYDNEVNSLLKEIWELSFRLSGELLHPIIYEYLNSLKKKKGYSYSKKSEELILNMSLGTVKNRIMEFRKKEGKKEKAISGTKPSELKRIIPIFFGDWKKKDVGYGQLDTVCLCNWSLSGDFMWALNYVDMSTYWSIFRFQWNKFQRATVQAFGDIIKRLPFPLIGVHSDSGSEFINWLLKDYCDEHNIELTRSRPGKKNDNHGVEERNGHIIRKFIGYHRLDCFELLDEWNILADKINLFVNHFKPVKRTIEKNKVNSKYIRKLDKAKTPFQRVLEHPTISSEIKDKIIKEHDKLNILSLHEEIVKMSLTLLEKNRKCNKKTKKNIERKNGKK